MNGLVDKFVWQACHCGCTGIPFVNNSSPSIYLPLTSQPSKFTLKRRPKIKLLYAFDLTLEPKEKKKLFGQMVDMLYCTSYFCDTLVLKHTLPAISHCGRK